MHLTLPAEEVWPKLPKLIKSRLQTENGLYTWFAWLCGLALCSLSSGLNPGLSLAKVHPTPNTKGPGRVSNGRGSVAKHMKGVRKLKGCQWLSHCHQIAIKSTTQRPKLGCCMLLQNSTTRRSNWSKSGARLPGLNGCLARSTTAERKQLLCHNILPLALAEWCAFLG